MTTMTKYTHSCVRFERDGHVLVIDPGAWSEPEALDGAEAILITHEHFDHVDADRLAAHVAAHPQTQVYAHADVLAQSDEVRGTAVDVGQRFTAAGFDIDVVGGEHAEIYDGKPGIVNLGFILDGAYHPGDALFVPDQPVSTLLVPAGAPWLKLAEAIEFIRAVGPDRAVPIHEAVLSAAGAGLTATWFENFGGAPVERLDSGESLSW